MRKICEANHALVRPFFPTPSPSTAIFVVFLSVPVCVCVCFFFFFFFPSCLSTPTYPFLLLPNFLSSFFLLMASCRSVALIMTFAVDWALNNNYLSIYLVALIPFLPSLPSSVVFLSVLLCFLLLLLLLLLFLMC